MFFVLFFSSCHYILLQLKARLVIYFIYQFFCYKHNSFDGSLCFTSSPLDHLVVVLIPCYNNYHVTRNLGFRGQPQIINIMHNLIVHSSRKDDVNL